MSLLGGAILFALGITFLGVYFIERYRKKHSSPMRAR